MDILLCQFEAPLMSFGTVQLDKHGYTGKYPCLSLLTGLIGNSLGFDRAVDTDKLAALQSGLSYAARCDRPGEQYRDFQTAFLQSPHMVMKPTKTSAGWDDPGRNSQWSSPSRVNSATVIRHRYYWSDAAYLVAISLSPTYGDVPAGVTTDDVEQALNFPARPLFLGRAGCFPTAPIFYKRVQADSLVKALQAEPTLPRATCGTEVQAIWPVHETGGPSRVVQLSESRDWRNSVHTGLTRMREGVLTLGRPS
jgi:CRISPR system Cascade subunit CasD